MAHPVITHNGTYEYHAMDRNSTPPYIMQIRSYAIFVYAIIVLALLIVFLLLNVSLFVLIFANV